MLRASTRFRVAVPALVVAGAGQVLAAQSRWQQDLWPAALLLLAGGAVAALGLGAPEPEARLAEQVAHPPRPAWWLLLPLLAGLAAGLFKAAGQGIPALFAWACALVALVAVTADPSPRPTPCGRSRPSTGLRTSLPHLSVPSLSRFTLPGRSGLALAVILLGAFGLRFAWLEVMPFEVHGDEGEFGLMSRALGPESDLFGTAWLGFPVLGLAPGAVSMVLFGDGLLGLRLASVALGVAAVAAVYQLGRELFGRETGLLSAMLLAVAHTAIHFSRLGINNIHPVPLGLWAFYFLAVGWRSARARPYGLAGVFAGLTTYSYYGGRVVPLVLCAFLLLAPLQAGRRPPPRALLALAMGFLVVVLPLAVHYLQTPVAWSDRQAAVIVFNQPDHFEAVYGTRSPLEMVLIQARQHAMIFNWGFDESPHYHARGPIVDVASGPLLVAGLILTTLYARRHPGLLLLSLWFWITIVVGGVLTLGVVYTRLTILVPALCVLVALVLSRLRQAFLIAFPAEQRASWLLIGWVLIAVVYANLSFYFFRYLGKESPISLATYVARSLPELEENVDLYLVSPERRLTADNAALRFLRPDTRAVSANSVDDLPETQGGRGIAIVLAPGRLDEVEVLRERFPGGEEGHYRFQDPGHEFVLYRTARQGN